MKKKKTMKHHVGFIPTIHVPTSYPEFVKKESKKLLKLFEVIYEEF